MREVDFGGGNKADEYKYFEVDEGMKHEGCYWGVRGGLCIFVPTRSLHSLHLIRRGLLQQ